MGSTDAARRAGMETRSESDHDEKYTHASESRGIRGADVEKQIAHEARESDGAG